MSWANGTDQIDVVNKEYVHGTISVSTSQIEVKVGSSPLALRQVIVIHNPQGNDVIYYGPTGVTISSGVPITAGETLSFPVGENIGVFLIKTGATQTVRIQELA